MCAEDDDTRHAPGKRRSWLVLLSSAVRGSAAAGAAFRSVLWRRVCFACAHAKHARKVLFRSPIRTDNVVGVSVFVFTYPSRRARVCELYAPRGAVVDHSLARARLDGDRVAQDRGRGVQPRRPAAATRHCLAGGERLQLGPVGVSPHEPIHLDALAEQIASARGDAAGPAGAVNRECCDCALTCVVERTTVARIGVCGGGCARACARPQTALPHCVDGMSYA